MNIPSPDETRLKALEGQIRRLDRRIQGMEALNHRYSWYRLAVILAGVALTWAAATWLSQGWVRLAAALSVLAFVVVVYFHRHLDGWISRFTIWRTLKTTQAARMTLDWEQIPESSPSPPQSCSSLQSDLDLCGRRSLHQLLDIAISEQGSLRLLDWLSQNDPHPEEIAARQRIVGELKNLSRFRDRLQLAFHRVSKEHLDGAKLLRWLQVETGGQSLGRTLWISAALAGVDLLLFGLNIAGKLPAYWVFTLILYSFFYFGNQKQAAPLLEAAALLDAELDKFREILRVLETYPYGDHPHLRRLCAPFVDARPSPTRRLRRIKLATAAIGVRMNPFLWVLLNLILPWDFAFAFLIQNYREDVARELPVWLDTWYELEALISLGSFAYLNPGYAFPEILPESREGDSPIFQAKFLGHPLIPPDRKVCNDFSLQSLGEITIITGSNMAGKSTFVRTLGINLCLAYAGGPVNAQSFRTLPFRLHTCIRISDSVTDGFSYFYAEVKCLKALLEDLQAEGQPPLLYLIDEIFRGTNNRERLIGSRSYVQALVGGRGVGLIATHDLELARLAERSQWIQNAHFRDEVADGKLIFDYKIRPGPSPTTNALKIMRMEGLPVDESIQA